MALKKACSQGYPESAVYVQFPIGSRNSAIHNVYHTSLRPSSLFEPRHPSLKVVSRESVQSLQNISTMVSKYPTAGKQGSHSKSALLPPSFSKRELMLSPSLSENLTADGSQWFKKIRANDPSAGSPTETLLRLLLPLSDKVH